MKKKLFEIAVYALIVLLSGVIAYTLITKNKEKNATPKEEVQTETTTETDEVAEEPVTKTEPVEDTATSDTFVSLISEDYLKECMDKTAALPTITSYEEYENLISSGNKYLIYIGRNDNVYCNAFSVVLAELLDRYELSEEVYFFDTSSYKTAIEKEEEAGIDDGDARQTWNTVKESLGITNSIPTVIFVEGENKVVWDSETAQDTYDKTYGNSNDDILQMSRNIFLQAYMKESFLTFITEN